MQSEEVRKGMTQAMFNEQNAGFLMLEIIVLAAGIGYITASWWVGGGLFFGLLGLMMKAPKAFALLTIAMSVAWGYAGWWLGASYIKNTGAATVIGLMALLVTAGLHVSGIEYLQDLSGTRKKAE